MWVTEFDTTQWNITERGYDVTDNLRMLYSYPNIGKGREEFFQIFI